DRGIPGRHAAVRRTLRASGRDVDLRSSLERADAAPDRVRLRAGDEEPPSAEVSPDRRPRRPRLRPLSGNPRGPVPLGAGVPTTRGTAVLLAGFAAAARGFGQQPVPVPRTPVQEQVHVTVVEVTLHATKGSGEPVLGLTPRDLRLFVDGHDEPIES